MNQITFKQYRAIDLALWCIITAVFEAVATVATNTWFDLQAMAISITLSMTCITILRWNYYAIFPALSGTLAFCIASDASIEQFAIYCGGALFLLISVPVALKIGKENIRQLFIPRTAFATIAYMALVLGRWLISLLFAPTVSTFVTFATSDILSLLFAILVLYVGKGLDGIMEDQKAYLFRLERERLAEQEANLKDNFGQTHINHISNGDTYEN